MHNIVKALETNIFWVIRFLVFWLFFLILADKRRWRELFSVSFFAIALGATTDNLMHHYQLWYYDYEQTNLFADLSDDWSVYIVVTYLFIQWLPQKRTFFRMISYWFVWTAISIFIEWIHVVTGHMHYPNWWNLGWSYASDWLLFYAFFRFHKGFKLEMLNNAGAKQ